ncbi:hypothetical protein [Porticoccus sp.]
MEKWTRDQALKWATSFEWGEDDDPSCNQVALIALASEVHRLHNRVECLRGLCKTASGWLLDAGKDTASDEILSLIGEVEAPLPECKALEARRAALKERRVMTIKKMQVALP